MYRYRLPAHMKASARQHEAVSLAAQRRARADLALAQKPIMANEGDRAGRVLSGTVTNPELLALERDALAAQRVHERAALRPSTQGVPHQPRQTVYREPSAHFLNTRRGRIQVVYKRTSLKRWAER